MLTRLAPTSSPPPIRPRGNWVLAAHRAGVETLLVFSVQAGSPRWSG